MESVQRSRHTGCGRIFNYLVLKEYLYLTDDGYTIVKLTAASRSFLEEGHILTMKMPKEQEPKKKRETEQTSEICSR